MPRHVWQRGCVSLHSIAFQSTNGEMHASPTKVWNPKQIGHDSPRSSGERAGSSREVVADCGSIGFCDVATEELDFEDCTVVLSHSCYLDVDRPSMGLR